MHLIILSLKLILKEARASFRPSELYTKQSLIPSNTQNVPSQRPGFTLKREIFGTRAPPPSFLAPEHKERGEPSDSELSPLASHISWHKRSIDKWQLTLPARPPNPNQRKREITSLYQFCPTTSMARLSTLCSQYSSDEVSSLLSPS